MIDNVSLEAYRSHIRLSLVPWRRRKLVKLVVNREITPLPKHWREWP